MGKRDSAILEILTREKRVEVSALAAALGVSHVTMRKDLDALEQRGVIQREHGFALLGNPDDINGRLAYRYPDKLRIAQAACELVHNSDTVMIESGSCCALLAATIARTRRDVTIITNSAFIAAYVRQEPSVSVILLGGSYQPDAQVVVGPMLRSCLEGFYVGRLFIGADGYVPATGFTNGDYLRGQAVADMAERAEEVVVLTESDKFGRRGVAPMRLWGKLSTVICDDRVTSASRRDLARHDVQVLTVPSVVSEDDTDDFDEMPPGVTQRRPNQNVISNDDVKEALAGLEDFDVLPER